MDIIDPCVWGPAMATLLAARIDRVASVRLIPAVNLSPTIRVEPCFHTASEENVPQLMVDAIAFLASEAWRNGHRDGGSFSADHPTGHQVMRAQRTMAEILNTREWSGPLLPMLLGNPCE